jgi:hypothetical protein
MDLDQYVKLHEMDRDAEDAQGAVGGASTVAM